MKTIDKLVNTLKPLRIGNHKSDYPKDGNTKCYYYFDTIIFEVTETANKKVYRTPYHGKYENARSTKRAINNYIKIYESLGFKKEG